MFISTIAILFVLGVVIFFHEIGHFLAAKRAGVRVDEFGIGFPPRLYKFTHKETTYAVNAIPFGGYVKLAGSDPAEATGEEGEFLSASIGKRAGIISAGSLVNVFLGFVIFSAVLMIGEPVVDVPNIIGEVKEGTPADRAGLFPLDRIVKVEGVEVYSWEEVTRHVQSKAQAKEIKLTIQRDDQLKEFILSYEKGEQLGVRPYLPAEIGTVRRGYPAQKAGLKPYDVVLAINEEPVEQWDELTEIIYHHPQKELEMKIRRNEDEFMVKITPVKREMLNEEGEIIPIGIIGIGPKTKIRRLGFISAIIEGFNNTIGIMILLFYNLWLLITGKLSLALFSGPVGIAQAISEEAHSGIINLLVFLAFLSVNLGVINLFPIPVLDGGHLVLLLVEKIRGKALSIKTHENITRVGIALLVSLILFVTYHDILRLIGLVGGQTP